MCIPSSTNPTTTYDPAHCALRHLFEYVTYRTPDEMCAVAQRIGELAKGWGITAATCGENKDLDQYGVEHNRCTDDRLMIKCFSHDKCLMDFLAGDNLVGRARRARRRQYEMPSLLFFESDVSISSQYTK